MRKEIQRTITATTILSSNVVLNSEGVETTENAPITVNGKISYDKALKLVRKTYGENAQIAVVNSIEDMYEISVEDFLKYATKVEAVSTEDVAKEV